MGKKRRGSRERGEDYYGTSVTSRRQVGPPPSHIPRGSGQYGGGGCTGPWHTRGIRTAYTGSEGKTYKYEKMPRIGPLMTNARTIYDRKVTALTPCLEKAWKIHF